ncbi:hypothetical protein [Microcoleus sp. D3_18_C4]|uniref:hypothetical protein n=1 Tax=Microcoleus sp. D3_18_C4 TaxID=3055335 RepID=UPI002FD50FB6
MTETEGIAIGLLIGWNLIVYVWWAFWGGVCWGSFLCIARRDFRGVRCRFEAAIDVDAI